MDARESNRKKKMERKRKPRGVTGENIKTSYTASLIQKRNEKKNKYNTYEHDYQLTTDADTLVPSIDTLTDAVAPLIGANTLTRAAEKLIWFSTRVVLSGDRV